MKKKSSSNLLLLGSLVLIVLAIGLVSLLSNTKSTATTTDVRARASAANALKVTGVVGEVNESAGTFTISSVQLDEESRSGDAKDLGTWTVTPPATFNLGQLTTGAFVTIGVDPKTFLAQSRTMSALTVTVK